jgi:hypothetical protein
MNQSKEKAKKVDQFLYQGRWADKATFRAFVYDRSGNEKLANNYPEFEALTTSGIWFASKPELSPPPIKQEKKNVALPNGK